MPWLQLKFAEKVSKFKNLSIRWGHYVILISLYSFCQWSEIKSCKSFLSDTLVIIKGR